MQLANCFTQESPHPIALNRFSQRFASDEAVAVMRPTIGRKTQGHQAMMVGTALPAESFKITTGTKPKVLLHPTEPALLLAV